MTNNNRVSELEKYVQYWQDAQSAVEEIRDRLIDDQLNGNALLDVNGDNVLPDRVRALDRTVIYHQKRLSFLRAVLNRAKAGDSPGKPLRLKSRSQT